MLLDIVIWVENILFIPETVPITIGGSGMQGGIHKVGEAFKAALEERGINVIHDETLHLPHDRGAYRRSRETAQRLLAKGPDVIFDVHRDAAPMHRYAIEIEDEWVTKVMFVVGRQNQHFAITKNFAYDLKGHADYIQPGLIKGVFKAQGNYNQDLTPLNLLLEVGGHENSRGAAEKGIRHFAEVVDFYFYGSPEEVPLAQEDGLIGRSAVKVVLGIAGFFILGGFALLWINAGSKEEFIKIILNWKDRVKESGIQSINFIKEKLNRSKMK